MGDNHSMDAIAVGNGVLAGLVSITAGSDVIHGDWALFVGLGGAVFYTLGSLMMERFNLDDVSAADTERVSRSMHGSRVTRAPLVPPRPSPLTPPHASRLTLN